LESAEYALDVKWLGVRLADIRNRSASGSGVPRQPLTPRDRSVITNLLVRDDLNDRSDAGLALRRELCEMRRLDRKAEIESLCPLDGEAGEASLAEYVVGKILRGEYV
jgi:DNA topoisomerase VI subunit A